MNLIRKLFVFSKMAAMAGIIALVSSCASTGAVNNTAAKNPSAPSASSASEVSDGFVINKIFNVSQKISGSGSFSAATEDSPVVVAPFYISQSEVTYSQWYEIYQWAVANGYSFANPGREGSDGTDGKAPSGSKKPVTNISWRDAVVWCNAASEKEGLSPVYLTSKGKIVKTAEAEKGFSVVGADGNVKASGDSGVASGEGMAENAVVSEDADGYRLPTEKEWEFAARGGNPAGKEWTFFYSGSDDDLNSVAWFSENSDKSAHEVMGKKANSYSVYDMSGNVWEWCYDSWYSKNMSRVIRGGSYKSAAGKCSVSSRDYAKVTGKYEDTGFRIVKSLK